MRWSHLWWWGGGGGGGGGGGDFTEYILLQSHGNKPTLESKSSFAKSCCVGPSEEVGHSHVTGYVSMQLYGFSMVLPVQK